MGGAALRAYDLYEMARAPEAIMVDREPGRGERGEDLTGAEGGQIAAASAVPADAIDGAQSETVRRTRFLEALEEVMRDHHDVLAALAK